MPITLILGGARSGKSSFAEKLALRHSDRPLYIATAEVYDDEMRARVDLHKERREDQWETIEEPLDLAGVLSRQTSDHSVILVDCLTLWLTNVVLAERNVEDEVENLIKTLEVSQATVILVSNEVGLGIVPQTKLGRDFRDHQGRLNQSVAHIAERVLFMIAGRALPLQTPQDLERDDL